MVLESRVVGIDNDEYYCLSKGSDQTDAIIFGMFSAARKLTKSSLGQQPQAFVPKGISDRPASMGTKLCSFSLSLPVLRVGPLVYPTSTSSFALGLQYMRGSVAINQRCYLTFTRLG